MITAQEAKEKTVIAIVAIDKMFKLKVDESLHVIDNLIDHQASIGKSHAYYEFPNHEVELELAIKAELTKAGFEWRAIQLNETTTRLAITWD